MAKEKGKTFSVLIIFLLTIALVVSSSLFWDMSQKNVLLLQEVEELKKTQVLLMVPDEQAQAVASWMAQHPEATQTLLSQAKPGEQVTLEIGPGAFRSAAESDEVTANDAKLSDPEPEMSQGVGIKAQVPLISKQQEKQIPVSLARESGLNELLPEIDQQSSKLNHANNNVLPIDEANKVSSNHEQQAQEVLTLSEDKDGVKVISLPHGGIRVTTRENNQ
ncbi:hypothetical protein [Shewanella sp. UCD-KL12]|uniref:hypothetical protein n=1 Tax=Shewanella sp. UCD-KL12 TaxID=1917163 RepID=UPI000970768C|nr:hypothetical protein [Shewanella sp. UCD-KL12]